MKEAYYEIYYSILNNTKKYLKRLHNNCSISFYLLSQLKVLCKSAIQFAENIINYTENQDVLNIAGQIIENANITLSEISSISGLCCKYKNSNADFGDFCCEMRQIYSELFEIMDTNTDNPENDYLSSMLALYTAMNNLLLAADTYDICDEAKAVIPGIVERNISIIEALQAPEKSDD